MQSNVYSQFISGEDVNEDPAGIMNRETSEAKLSRAVTALENFPPYVPEEQNPNVLIKGRWLERGGSGWFISTSGTGKSIHSLQLSLSLIANVPFGGLSPNVVLGENGELPPPLRIWICQTEDSPTRITIDREDVIAELTDQRPEIKWRDVARLVSFVDLNGKTGADAIAELDTLLQCAEFAGSKPDIVIFNPFMAFVGGPVCDSNYVTPFLRGGEIGHKQTIGMQGLITKHRVGAIFYHHTPKPPSKNELEAWENNQYPEYQGAGSSDITNWGRSFITMIRQRDDSKRLVMTAGKNGGELGWRRVGNALKYVIAWAGKPSPVVNGALRHAWRDLTPEEEATLFKDQEQAFDNDINECIDGALERMRGGHAYYSDAFREEFSRRFNRSVARAAWNRMTKHDSENKYRYQIANITWGFTLRKYIGFADGIEIARNQGAQQRHILLQKEKLEAENAENDELMERMSNESLDF